VNNSRFLTARMVDRNRKGAMCVVLEEHIIAEGVLNAREFVVWHWMGEAKTNDENSNHHRLQNGHGEEACGRDSKEARRRKSNRRRA
jgi:hypothetical protein